jgi:hypothetical protein
VGNAGQVITRLLPQAVLYLYNLLMNKRAKKRLLETIKKDKLERTNPAQKSKPNFPPDPKQKSGFLPRPDKKRG